MYPVAVQKTGEGPLFSHEAYRKYREQNPGQEAHKAWVEGRGIINNQNQYISDQNIFAPRNMHILSVRKPTTLLRPRKFPSVDLCRENFPDSEDIEHGPGLDEISGNYDTYNYSQPKINGKVKKVVFDNVK